MTSPRRREILRARMRRALALAALLAALAATACSSPCQDLGDRLCSCTTVGTARDTCKQQVKDQLDASSPSKSTEDVCTQKLSTCNAPSGAEFCEWILTSCGKFSCGLTPDPTATNLCP